MAQKRRAYRVAEKLREILAQALLFSRDERFQLVTISSVQLSSDLRYAKIYWMVTHPEQRRSTVEIALDEQTGALRQKVAAELGTRHVPELEFFYDASLDEMEKVDKLLKRANGREDPVNDQEDV